MPVATIADLPLELLKTIACHLDVKDVLEFMMVNKRLYSIYAMDQSIIFGKHVAVVLLGETLNWIKKFVDSPYLQLNANLLPFVKRIDSCDKLDVRFNGKERNDVMFLDQLKFVKEFRFYAAKKEDCLKFFTNFCGSTKKNARLDIGIDSLDEAIKEQLSKFIENRLNRCEKIKLYCFFEDCFKIFREIIMTTQIKRIAIVTDYNPLILDPIVDCIVHQGIPTKYSEAVIHVVTQSRDSRVSDFLSKVQGLQRVDEGENHSALVSRANDLRENYTPYSFDKNNLCFRRRIDPRTICIYVCKEEFRYGEFLAFYMPSK